MYIAVRREILNVEIWRSRAPKLSVCMPNGLGEGCEVGASAPTSTNSTVLHSFRHARIGSTSSITGRASTSPIRARPIINAIGAACRHASLHSGAPALSSVHCGQTMHRLSWRQHASPMGQAARSRPLAAFYRHILGRAATRRGPPRARTCSRAVTPALA